MPGKWAKDATKKLFARKLVECRGIPLKISQILSCSKDDFKADLQKDALTKLDPIPLQTLIATLKSDPSKVLDDIQTISEKGIPASLGQVHEVTLKNSKSCALKVRYPDFNASMTLDQQALGLVLHSFDQFKEGFSMKDYHQVIKTELEEECRYQSEVQKQLHFFNYWKKNDDIIIPEPYPASSGDGHILMSWEESMPISVFKQQASPQQKKEASRLLLDFFLGNLFYINHIHADPNPGNFGFRILSPHRVQLVVYDYGSALSIDREVGLTLLNCLSRVDKNEADLLPWLVKLGFSEELLKPLEQQLNAFLDLLFEPLLSEHRYNLSDWKRKERAQDILGSQRWNFMVAAPAGLLPFMRSIQGLFYYIDQLDVGLFARPEIESLWNTFKIDLERLEAPRLKTCNKASCMAQYLQINVLENNRSKVSLTLPRNSIENLEDFMDAQLMQKLEEDGISLGNIIKKARQHGYRPMPLFEINSGEKNIHVFLE